MSNPLTLKQKLAISPLTSEVVIYEAAIKSNPKFTDYYRAKITVLEERINNVRRSASTIPTL